MTGADEMIDTMAHGDERRHCAGGARGCPCVSVPSDLQFDVRDLPLDQRCPVISAAMLRMAPGETLVVVTEGDPLPRLTETLGPRLADFEFRRFEKCPATYRVTLTRH